MKLVLWITYLWLQQTTFEEDQGLMFVLMDKLS